MTTPTNPMQTHASEAQAYLEQAATLLVKAAEKSDSATGLGIDDRISLGHSLVDLWVKSYVALLQAWIAGPIYGSGQASEPAPSEYVKIPPQKYPRQLTAAGAFVRVGIPTVTIPKSSIGFEPATLPPGTGQFRIVLKDHRFVGANYTGKVALTSTATGATNEEKVVTVGL